MPRRSVFVVALVTSALALSACGAGSDNRPSLSSQREPTNVTTSTTLPAYMSQVAQASVLAVSIYDSPNAPKPSNVFPNPWYVNDQHEQRFAVPLVFLVTGHQGSWYRVLLPTRPNGSQGWIRAREVRITAFSYRIKVELSAHRITVFNGESILLQETVAVGKPSTPTPPGRYFLRILWKAPDPNTVYGPYAYGLSGYSNVLTSFDGGDGELGIHGNNDASVLGQSITHGCVRMSNASITRLSGILPLGTPVDIVA